MSELGKNVRAQKRPSGLVSAYWVWPRQAKQRRFKTKTVLLIRDFANASPEQISAASLVVDELNREAYEFIRTVPAKRRTAARKPKQLVDRETLMRFLSYDAEAGEFYWNEALSEHIKVGDVAGFVHPITGYVIIGLLGKTYLGHRLAWFYTYGEWPENHVDHIDRNRSNNRIVNLRDVTPAENMQNAKGPSPYPSDPWRRSARRLRKSEENGAGKGVTNPIPFQFTKSQ